MLLSLYIIICTCIMRMWNTSPTRLTTYALLQNNIRFIICLVHLYNRMIDPYMYNSLCKFSNFRFNYTVIKKSKTQPFLGAARFYIVNPAS